MIGPTAMPAIRAAASRIATTRTLIRSRRHAYACASPRTTSSLHVLQQVQPRGGDASRAERKPHNKLIPPSRHFSSQRFSPSTSLRPKDCPYRTLGVSPESEYAVVKRAFLKVAMSHHPDVVGKEDPEQHKLSEDLFVRSRMAFEAIVEVDDGGSALRAEVELEKGLQKSKMSDEEFDAWFVNETGHSNPFQFDIDPATMREVADMHEEVHGQGGLDRDGGMWTLASMVSRSVKGGKEAGSILRLEAGAIREDEEPVDGVLRRRRRRGRGRR